MNKKDLITVKELAHILGYHPLTIQRLAREGKIKGFRVNKRWLFIKAEVFDSLKKQ